MDLKNSIDKLHAGIQDRKESFFALAKTVKERHENSIIEKTDADFLSDLRVAALQGPRFLANLLLWVIFFFFLVLILWASFAEIDEITSGVGKIIPSGHSKIVQNLEGGLIEDILVDRGLWDIHLNLY